MGIYIPSPLGLLFFPRQGDNFPLVTVPIYFKFDSIVFKSQMLKIFSIFSLSRKKKLKSSIVSEKL